MSIQLKLIYLTQFIVYFCLKFNNVIHAFIAKPKLICFDPKKNNVEMIAIVFRLIF